jgi:putative transposase
MAPALGDRSDTEQPRKGRKKMPQSFTHLVVHIVFSTKDRARDLVPELSSRLFPYMGGIIKELRGMPLIINGPLDHVHLLVSLPATASVAEMLRVVKTNSSRWVHEQFPMSRHFGWQAGYGAFSVSGSRLATVRSYIASQEEHHREISFQEEFLTLLKRHGLVYELKGLRG